MTGDMFAEPLPKGCDLQLYSHVLHDWEPGVRSLLAASFAALPPGGVTIDYEAHIDADNTGSCPRWCSISLFLMHSTRGKVLVGGRTGGDAPRGGRRHNRSDG